MIKRANQKKKKGFSLIELIIVLAVMAIIALIAIPNFTAVRESSKVKADKESCETIKRTVLMMVANEEIIEDGSIEIGFTGGVATSTDKTTVTDPAGNDVSDEIEKALKESNEPQAKMLVSTAPTVDEPSEDKATGYLVTLTSGEVEVATIVVE